MQDQMILWLISKNPPPFKANPHIIEWIECQATHYHNCLDIEVVQISMEQASEAHIKETNTLYKGLSKDLKDLCKEADRQISETWDSLKKEVTEIKASLYNKHEQEISSFKAQLWTEKETRKNHLKHNDLLFLMYGTEDRVRVERSAGASHLNCRLQ